MGATPELSIHGLVYSLANGLITDLEVSTSRPNELKRGPTE